MDHNWWLALLGIIGMDLLLSGDNAMVIALVCGGLPERQRKWGIIAGTGAAILLRVGMALIAGWLLSIPGLALLGGLYLLWVGVKLIYDHGGDDGAEAKTTLWAAITTIAIADASMSLDNVAAIAALSGGDGLLMALGVLISIPLIIVGATAITWMLQRAPWLLWLGAGLLGAIAAKVAVHDPLVARYAEPHVDPDVLKWSLMVGGVVLVLGVGALINWAKKPAAPHKPVAQRLG